MKLKGKICSVSVRDLIAVGCEGWLYLLDSGGSEIWRRRMLSTYYRGPYEDVKVISVDVGDVIIAGTDFTDGKVYVFNTEGECLWSEQFMTVMGCWQRPNDVVAVRCCDYILVCDEWMNATLRIYEKNGKSLRTVRLKGFFRDMSCEEMYAVGTTECTYFGNVSVDIPSNSVKVRGDRAYCANNDCVFCLDRNGLRWKIGFRNPVFDVDDVIAVCDDRGLTVLSHEGEVIERRRVDERPLRVFVVGDSIYLGYRGKVVGEETVSVRGVPVHVGERIVSVEDREIHVL